VLSIVTPTMPLLRTISPRFSGGTEKRRRAEQGTHLKCMGPEFSSFWQEEIFPT